MARCTPTLICCMSPSVGIATAFSLTICWLWRRVQRIADEVAAGIFARGERHWNAKLSEANARGILASDDPRGVLADRFGVAPSTVSSTRRGRTGTWLRDGP